MEELLSSEVLDREILEDARRKAQRILKTAGETETAGKAAWEQKTQEAIGGLKQRYTERLEQNRMEIMARLPLDKRRSRLEKIDSLLRQAAQSYLARFSRERMIALLSVELAKRAGELALPAGDAREEFQVWFRGLSAEDLEGVIGGSFPHVRWMVGDERPYFLPGTFPAIVLDTPAVRIFVSADGAIESLLGDKRVELVAALLGQGVLDA